MEELTMKVRMQRKEEGLIFAMSYRAHLSDLGGKRGDALNRTIFYTYIKKIE